MNKCLYIEIDTLDENSLLALKLVEKYRTVYFSLWFYPEISKAKQTETLYKLKNNFFKTDNLIPMTYYEGEKRNTLKSNDLFLYNNNSKNIILDNINIIKKDCDSILFYLENNSDWIVGEIFHEKILLAKGDIQIKKYLKDENISFSENPPSWW